LPVHLICRESMAHLFRQAMQFCYTFLVDNWTKKEYDGQPYGENKFAKKEHVHVCLGTIRFVCVYKLFPTYGKLTKGKRKFFWVKIVNSTFIVRNERKKRKLVYAFSDEWFLFWSENTQDSCVNNTEFYRIYYYYYSLSNTIFPLYLFALFPVWAFYIVFIDTYYWQRNQVGSFAKYITHVLKGMLLLLLEPVCHKFLYNSTWECCSKTNFWISIIRSI